MRAVFVEQGEAAVFQALGGVEQLSHYRIPGTRITIARVEEGPNGPQQGGPLPDHNRRLTFAK